MMREDRPLRMAAGARAQEEAQRCNTCWLAAPSPARYLDKLIATLQMELAARFSKHELLESADGKAGKEKGFYGDQDQYRVQ